MSDGRWEGGCFYRPHGTTCETALSSPENEKRASKCNVCAAVTGVTSIQLAHPWQNTTQEVARAVTAYVRDDLVRFGYPVWRGDVTQPWY